MGVQNIEITNNPKINSADIIINCLLILRIDQLIKKRKILHPQG